ncbi:Arylsulfatase precursor [Thalassoglobus neptunius]|uniref:Arylsulfatase n=1 Tax=Thalassoglobus neptunius TaxID=1938619 RepID=A0A5C5X4S3_9PLAN|nr:sulfatase-like hydrolase/transferase [Thalassoglobus neptunius]TWT57900.1 Arylsulfatase precursor [Thalassoglobus neptunius]
MFQTLGRVTLLCCLFLIPTSSSVIGAESTPPNIVFIFIDDMGYGDLSCFRDLGTDGWDSSTIDHYPETTHIDKLAEEGVRLTNFYVASPICSPSRVGCTTGQFPSRHLINSYLNHRKRNRARGMADYLRSDIPTIAKAFQSNGYATAHFGKWHQGGGRDVDDAPLPTEYGFDESLVSFEGLGDRILPPGGLSDQSAKLNRGTITRVEKHEQTLIYIDRSIEFMKRNKENPFYLHLWLNDVHDAHKPAPGTAEAFASVTDNPNEQKFFAVLVEMDKQIGRLIDAIDEEGLNDNTLVLLTSDNGPTAWGRYYKTEHLPAGSTAGFRGRKWSLYEGGIRMPMIARWPGKITPNTINKQLIFSTVDFFPTLTALAGIELSSVLTANGVNSSADEYFDGEDLGEKLLTGKGQRTRPLFWEYGRDPSYLKPGLKEDQSPNLAVRDGRWKLLINADGSDVQLYDLKSSDTEVHDVSAEHPKVTKRLRRQLLKWRKDLPSLPQN